MTNVIDFGADPTGQQSSSNAFALAFGTGSKFVDVPAGLYRLTSDLVPPSGVRIRGDGGAFRAAATTLHLAGVATIRIGANGRSTTLSDIAIRGDRYAQRDALVVITAEAFIERAFIYNSGKHGVRIDGASGVGNANGWVMDRVSIENCGEAAPGQYANEGHCVRVSGQDAQGTGRTIRCISSFGGILDRSNLGVTWTDCHAEGCVGNGYTSDTARSTWVGCYCELDSPVAMGSCLILGGTLAAITKTKNAVPSGRLAPTVYDVDGVSPSQVLSRSPTVGARTFVGFADGRTTLAWQANEDAHEFALTAVGSTPETRVWSLARARAAALAALQVTRLGHALGPDQLIAPKGIHLPAAQGSRKIDAAWLDTIEARIKALEEQS